jgi:CheY-like chemotaxis protein
MLLNGMRSLLERSLGETIRIEIGEGETSLYCLADRVQLEGVILNLAINARDAMADGGTLSIRASHITLDGKRAVEHAEAGAETHVVIAIRDTGVGIPAEILGKVFEPFFTTKDVGEGTGLGLSMAYGFAKQSGGHVEIDSTAGEGTEVRVHLPVAEAPSEALEIDGDTAGPRGRGESVLVVEDEAAVRKLVVAFLEELNYAVHTVEDGAEALIALESMPSVDLLLSDVVLPGKLSGREVAREVRRRRPQVRVLLMSGYAEKVLNKDGPLEPDEAFLPKPFRKVDLARKVRLVLDSVASG